MDRLEAGLRAALAAIGLLVLLSYLGLAWVHLGTLYDINQTSGAWLAFAHYARHGVLYPPLFQDGYYAGTRYMPGFFVLHALLARLVGSELEAGKLLTLLCTLAVVAALGLVLKRRGLAPWLAAGLAALPLATFVGYKGSLTIRSDVLPLALGLWALVIFEARRTSPGLWISALLGGAAPLVKFTSFHPLFTGFLCLAPRARLRALLYGALGMALFVAGLGLTNLLSAGRFFESLSTSALGPGSNKRGLLEALSLYAYYLRADRAFLLLLVPAAAALIHRPKLIQPWRIYFCLQLFISVGFFLDTGAEYNHLIDLLAASLLLGAELLLAERRALRLGALALMLAAGAYGLIVHHHEGWTTEERDATPQRVLVEELDLGGKRVFSQDPTVSVLLGQRPVVADDFQYRALIQQRLVPEHELAERIRAQAFDRVVLLNPPEEQREDPQYLHHELGLEVARAVRERYALSKKVRRFYLYVPREP